MKKPFYLENHIQNIDLKIHHMSCNEINLNNRNMLLQMSSNVTLIASNLGARDVIVHFEIVFILFFLFTILSPVNLETRGDPFEMRFFKISARSNNNFLRPYFSSHLISEFRALSITHTKKNLSKCHSPLVKKREFHDNG